MDWERLERFRDFELQLSHEYGDFVFFALFLREDTGGAWDLIVSAPWMSPDEQVAVEFLVDQIKQRLGDQELVGLTRIEVIDSNDPSIQALNRRIQARHGQIEVLDSSFFGVAVKHAHIITSAAPPSPAAASA